MRVATAKLRSAIRNQPEYCTVYLISLYISDLIFRMYNIVIAKKNVFLLIHLLCLILFEKVDDALLPVMTTIANQYFCV